MTKTEYMNTINEKLTAAEGLCADLRKLRGLKKLAQSITGSDALVSFEALGKTIADKEAELKTVRGELQKARRIVKKLDEIEAIEAGTAPAPAPKKQDREEARGQEARQGKVRAGHQGAPGHRHPGGLRRGCRIMTYLKILMYARAGIQAKIDEYRGMQERALEGAGAHAGAKTLARKCQEMIDDLEVDMATIDELQEIHDRK